MSRENSPVDLLLLNHTNYPARPIFPYAFVQVSEVARRHRLKVRRLDLFPMGRAAWEAAVAEALERNTPRASSVAFLLRRRQRSSPAPLAVDLSRHPEAQAIEVRPHNLETYDELARKHYDDSDQ